MRTKNKKPKTPIAIHRNEKPNIQRHDVLSRKTSSGSSSFGRTTAEIRAKKEPSWPMKMLNGDAVAYMAKGTYSSIILLVMQSDMPHPKPEMSLDIVSIQKSINCVKMAPIVKTRPVKSKALRLP